MGEVYAYARVSTDDQDLTLQLTAFERAGVPSNHVFSEHASGKSMKRKELQYLVTKFLRRGDKLVVWKLDRLGRDLPGVLEMIDSIQKRGIEFQSLTEQFDTQTPMGKAFLQIALVFAELERNMISERTKAGMAAAKAAGARFGRAHTIRDYPKRIQFLRDLDAKGKLRDEQGELLMSAEVLKVKLNEADKKAPKITNAETVRRWKRDGFLGLGLTNEN